MEVLLRPIVSEMDRAIFLDLGLFSTFYTFYTFFLHFSTSGALLRRLQAVTSVTYCTKSSAWRGALISETLRPGVFLLWRGVLKVLAQVL